jgi:hypothetical protein
VNQKELEEKINDKNNLITPWFSLIYKNGFLFKWWDSLIDNKLENVLEINKIHDFTKK